MEERIGWGEAIGTAWANLTGINNEGGSVRTIRWLFFLIFLGGTAWAVYNFVRGQEMLEEKSYYPEPAPINLEADRRRLDGMVGEVQLTYDTRTGSERQVSTMEAVARYAFADPTLDVNRRPPEPPGDKPEIVIAPPVIAIEMPPEITLRAIMIMGKQRVAILDIAGVGNGLMVRAGDTFVQNKGRVVQIAPDKVVLRWGGNTFDVRPNF
ncbi:MAG: hypothetical protein LBQ90_12365 [Synergistaceae bacterium]|jgi:hypothetical protein|nr:hypothetical protein [Synergistaceae bacterium]